MSQHPSQHGKKLSWWLNIDKTVEKRTWQLKHEASHKMQKMHLWNCTGKEQNLQPGTTSGIQCLEKYLCLCGNWWCSPAPQWQKCWESEVKEPNMEFVEQSVLRHFVAPQQLQETLLGRLLTSFACFWPLQISWEEHQCLELLNYF